MDVQTVQLLHDKPPAITMLEGEPKDWDEAVDILDNCCAEANGQPCFWVARCNRLFNRRCEANPQVGGWGWCKVRPYRDPATPLAPDVVRYADSLPILYRRTVVSLLRERRMST